MKAGYGVTIDVFVAKDNAAFDCYTAGRKLIMNVPFADVVNDLRGEIVTVNRQSTMILDMMIDGR